MVKNAINTALQNKNALMFITALIFMAGILAYFNDNAILCAGILTLTAVVTILKNYLPLKYILFWIFIFYFGFFNAYFRIHTTDGLVPYAWQEAVIEGQIISIPNSNSPDKTKFFLKADKINGKEVTGKTLVTFTGNDFSNLQIGDNYEFSGKLRTPFKAGNPSQFDYGKYLRNFDTFTVFYTDNAKLLNGRLTLKWKFYQNLNKLRNKIINVHAKYLKSPNLEILGGIVFGDDAVAPPDYIKASFVNSGLLHILAASGMNVAFIYGFWVFFMRRIRAPFKLTVLTGMGVVIIYTFMTGLGASVIRAALMLLFILAGKLIDRDAHTVSLLAFVAMLMLIYNPAFINDVGFQLSFIVTFGLLTTANVIFEKYKESKIPDWLIAAILIPVIAQIWVAPIQMFYFNTFSTYSVLANVLSMPFLSVISFGGFVSSIIAILTPFTDKICMLSDIILNFILNILVFISDFFAGLPHSLLTTTHPNIFQLFIYYGIVLFVTMSIKTGFNKRLVSTCILLFTILLLSLINIPSNDLQIIAFDVQNADCFLIKTPRNKYFIIDTGRAGYKGSKAQANSIIIKYLKDRGIKNIEGMIITHFDNDHSGGAVDIMKNLNVKQVYINSFEDKSMTSTNIYKTLKELKIPSQIPNNNKSIYSENSLNMQTYLAEAEEDNEKSIITLLSYKDFDMLFTGDAGTDAFNQLKKDIPHNIEVLKVGHHGGPHVVSSEMLNHLNTKVSVISTGPNAFGHPNKGTLDILRKTDIYRTDRHNSIKIISDGQRYTMYTFNKDKKKYQRSKDLKTD
ncbi:MAG TPA: DNA internalization-related competence protein ComEC/Rec2 [Candidatus Stercorousia faecigallinarum]|nr:DNA internalization-related competence protein ComEC/Rec2 [Candidatus Stercorousia faecigallinarum]